MVVGGATRLVKVGSCDPRPDVAGVARAPLYRLAPDTFLQTMHGRDAAVATMNRRWRTNAVGCVGEFGAGGSWEWCDAVDDGGGGEWFSWASVRRCGWEERVQRLRARRAIADSAGEGWAAQLARTRAKRMHALHGNGVASSGRAGLSSKLQGRVVDLRRRLTFLLYGRISCERLCTLLLMHLYVR